jgi:protein-disulfide isomerase
LLGALAIGLLAAIISIAVGQGGPEEIRIDGAGQVQELIAGVAQDGPYLGPSDAAVTIAVFNDLQCPSCADYQLETVDPLIEEYARGGQARLEFHNFSLGQTDTTKAAYAATAAGEQDREWQYVELFFRNQDAAPQGTVTDEFLQDIGNAIPDFDLDSWKTARDSPEVKARVESDAKLAIDLRLSAQPAIGVSGPGGTRQLEDKPSQAEVEAAVAAVGGS